MLPMHVKGKPTMKPSAYTNADTNLRTVGATLNALCLGTAAAKNFGLSLEHQAVFQLARVQLAMHSQTSSAHYKPKLLCRSVESVLGIAIGGL